MHSGEYDSDAPLRREQQFEDGAGGVQTQGYPQQGYGQQGYPQQAYPQQAYPQQGYGPPAYAYGQPRWGRTGGGFGFGRATHRRHPIETKPFFLTSEFVGTLLAIIALASTAAAMPNLGARITWILIAALVFSYAISRGLAKAATRSYSVDPRESLLTGDGCAQHQQSLGGPRAGYGGGIETKPSFLTSEFLGTVLAIVALAISTAVLDSLNVRLGWILITAMVCGYVVSRGIAKVGVKSYAFDPREDVLQQTSDGQTREAVAGR